MAIIILLSLSAVSAAEIEDNPSPLSANENNDVLKAPGDGTFKDLRDDINTQLANDPQNVKLDKNYTFSDSDLQGPNPIEPTSGIVIAVPCTIDGQNNYVDGNHLSRIFTISGDNVVLKNIKFLNANHTAVWLTGSNCIIDNCTFANNSINGSVDTHGGGAIYWKGTGGKVINSVFNNNSVIDGDDKFARGGSIFWTGDDGNVSYCNFTDDYSKKHSASISWGSPMEQIIPENGYVYRCNFERGATLYNGAALNSNSKKFKLIECNFTNNTAVHSPIVIEDDAVNSLVSHCNFIGNKVIYDDTYPADTGEFSATGALEVQAPSASVEYCNFINNTAIETVSAPNGYYVGALKVDGGSHYTNVSYCNFINNSATHYAGAIEWQGTYGTLKHSNFTNNSATEGYAGAVYWRDSGSNGTVLYSDFTNNSADGDGGAIYWEGASGTVFGSNFTGNNATAGSGGAIYWEGVSGNVSCSDFTNNFAEINGGAINWEGVSGNVSCSNFTSNSAEGDGGAIHWSGDYGNVTGSNFTLNNAANNGGAIKWEGESGTVSGSNFTGNNVADKYGGAISWYGAFGTVFGSNFTGNNATEGGGAIYWEGDYSAISYSDFTNNFAKNNGGAINLYSDDCTVSYSNFTSNSAEGDGGAIYLEWTASVTGSVFINNNATKGGAIYNVEDDSEVVDSNFTSNSAEEDGGAIYWDGDYGTVTGSNFTLNNATNNGGAIKWYGASGTVSGSDFTSNSAEGNGGAIYWEGEFGNVSYSNFTGNSANNGGALDLNYATPVSSSDFTKNVATNNGGAILIEDDWNNVIDSNFTGNSANNGGAIYWGSDYGSIFGSNGILNNSNFANNAATENGGAIYYFAPDQDIDYANFTGNTAVYGGAIFTEANNIDINVTYFNDNNATNGSAIYKTKDATGFNIANALFERNQAHSKAITIDIKGNKTYALAKVTVNITMEANDNIANAIWNDGNSDSIKLYNIQCEFSADSKGRALKSFNTGDYDNPTDGFKNDDSIWQSPYEDAQLIDIIIRNETGVIYNLTGGINHTNNNNNLLSALPDDSGLIVTKTDGSITIEFNSLNAGKYTVDAVHNEDRYYKEVGNQNSFVIYDVVLNVTKTPDVYVTLNDSLVNFTIVVKNTADAGNATNVNLTDILPATLIFEKCGVVNANGAHITNTTRSSGVEWSISNITSGKEVSLWIQVRTNGLGPLVNNVTVYCDENATKVNASAVVNVGPVILEINKTANVSEVTYNNLVNFTITVNNTNANGYGIDANNVTVVDVLPEGLTVEDAGVVTPGIVAKWNKGDLPGYREFVQWNISKMARNSVVELWVSVRVNFGSDVKTILTNNVNVTCEENSTEVKNKTDITYIPADLSITKDANVTVVTNNTLVNFTIIVNNTSEIKLTNVVVNDIMPSGLSFVECGIIDRNGNSISLSDGKTITVELGQTSAYRADVTLNLTYLQDDNEIEWDISEIAKNSYVKLWVVALVNTTAEGTLVNVASAISDEIPEERNDDASIEVVPVVLNITKKVDVSPVANNTVVNFTIVVGNDDLGNATDVIVIDQLPEGLTFVDAGVRKNQKVQVTYLGQYNNGAKWNISKLNSKEVVELWIAARTNVTSAKTLTNYATVTSKENDTEVKAQDDVEVYDIILNINKTANVTVIGNNSLVNYTIVVSNFNNVAATNLTICDQLPDELIFEDIASEGYSYNPSTRVISWKLTKLDANDIHRYYVVVRTGGIGAITNAVNVTCNENRTEVKNTTKINVEPLNLTIVKSTNLTENANVSDLIRFIINITNNGPANATNVVISDDIMTVFDIMEVGNNGQRDGNKVTWTIPELVKGETKSVYVIVNATKNGIYKNVAVANCNENNTNVSSEIPVIVLPAVAFEIIKTANPDVVRVGNNVTFTITVTNLGPSNATDVNITDVLDDAFKFDGKSTTVACDFDGKTIVWHIGNLENGSSFSVSFNVIVLTNGTLPNVATVNSTENTTGASNSTNITAIPVVDLKINKTVDKTKVTVGDEITYIIIITNLGPSVATNVNVTENMTGNVKITDIKGDGVYNRDEGIWYVGTLNKGDIAKLTITVKTLAFGKVENVVVANSTQEDRNTSNNKYSCENVTVNYPSLVNGVNVTVVYGDPINVDYNSTNATEVSYEIYDELGNMVANGTVGPDGTISVKQLDVGNYTVYWNNTVDENHIPANNISSIKVLPAPSLVNGTDVTVDYGNPIEVPYNSTNAAEVTYQIFDKDGNPIVNGTVGPDGIIPVDQLPVGEYLVNWTTIVDGNHIPATNTSSITVLPAPSLVEGEDVTVYYGDPIRVDYDSTNATDVVYVIYDKDGKVVAEGTVGPDGTIPVNQLPVGEYLVNWTTIVDGNHIPATNTSSITVLPIPTHVSVGNVTTFAGKEVTIPIKVTADDGKPFTGKVTIRFPDGSTKVVNVINGNGKTTWFVPYDYTPGKYPDHVRFAGNDKYLPSEGDGTITVIKIPVDIVVGKVTARPGDDVTIPIKVIPRDGSTFNGKVTVELPDGTRKVIDIVNGRGKIPWTVPKDYKPGTYPVKVYSNETNIYYPANGTGTVTVIVDHPVDNVTAQKPADHSKSGLAKHETGNPILVLIAVLALLGVNIKRRK